MKPLRKFTESMNKRLPSLASKRDSHTFTYTEAPCTAENVCRMEDSPLYIFRVIWNNEKRAKFAI